MQNNKVYKCLSDMKNTNNPIVYATLVVIMFLDNFLKIISTIHKIIYQKEARE